MTIEEIRSRILSEASRRDEGYVGPYGLTRSIGMDWRLGESIVLDMLYGWIGERSTLKRTRAGYLRPR